MLPVNWQADAVLLDAMVLVRSTPIHTHHKTFSHYAKSFVEKYILPHTKKPNTQGVHVLFDHYIDGLEGIKKKVKHLVTTYPLIKGSNPLPKETWVNFLSNRTNSKVWLSFYAARFSILYLPF